MSVLTELQEAVAAVATAAAPSVVGIGSRTRGSGVVIADGAVLTNAHNLRGGGIGEPLRHDVCGTPLEARWHCPTCNRTVDDGDAIELTRL